MLLNVAEFATKTALVVVAVCFIAIVIAFLVAKAKGLRESLQVDDINEKLNDLETALRGTAWTPKMVKTHLKRLKKQKPKKDDDKKRIFVLTFEGDLRASGVDRLRDEITAVLTVARPDIDECIVKVESPGGMVHTYGLAAAQLLRLRDAKIQLTICVDEVAASGGYLMACTGHKILAAPFAIVGSIGVLAQVPNFNRFLKKHEVDFEEVTAGEFKRTLTVLGENTPKGRQKFQEKIEATHTLFKDFVGRYRPQLKLEDVANGDYWYGTEALKLKLIDEIMSSDEYILRQRDEARIFKLELQQKKKLADRLAENFSAALERSLHRVLKNLNWV